LVNNPGYLDAIILPDAVKQQYMQGYQLLIDRLNNIQVPKDYNASDPNNYLVIVKDQVQMCMNILSQPAPADADQVYGYDARVLYPELAEVWNQYDY
jgi:hypothetical protein